MKPAKSSKPSKFVSNAAMFDHMRYIVGALEALETLLVEKMVLVDGELQRRMTRIAEEYKRLENLRQHGEEDAKVQ